MLYLFERLRNIHSVRACQKLDFLLKTLIRKKLKTHEKGIFFFKNNNNSKIYYVIEMQFSSQYLSNKIMQIPWKTFAPQKGKTLHTDTYLHDCPTLY